MSSGLFNKHEALWKARYLALHHFKKEARSSVLNQQKRVVSYVA